MWTTIRLTFIGSNLRLHVIARLSLNGFSKAWRKSRPSSVACAQSVVRPQPPSNPRLKTDVANAARLSSMAFGGKRGVGDGTGHKHRFWGCHSSFYKHLRVRSKWAQ